MRFFKSRKGLTVLLCVVLAIGGMVLLYRYYAVNDLAPHDRILPVPAVYGGETGDGFARETEIRFFGKKNVEVEDSFVLHNKEPAAQSYTVVYPVLPCTQNNLGEVCELWVNGTRCTSYEISEAVRFSYGDDLTPVEDGAWFRGVFPEGLAHRTGPDAKEADRYDNCVRYYVQECTLAPGETLELRVMFRYGSTATIRFCANYDEAPIQRHTVTLSGTDSVSVGGNLSSARELKDGDLELDPTRKDYYLASRAYKYR